MKRRIQVKLERREELIIEVEVELPARPYYDEIEAALRTAEAEHSDDAYNDNLPWQSQEPRVTATWAKAYWG